MREADAGGTIRVLLADDEQPFLDALSPLIERQPQLAVVGTALDGLAAIELADELGPDAVVIDLHMPRLDGVSAVARLRRDHPSMCVIALTGDKEPALHTAVTEAGADAVLMKGEFVDVLVARLAAARAPAARRLPAKLSPRPGEVAQLVEHTAENRGVAGSIPALAISAAKSGRRFAPPMMTLLRVGFRCTPMSAASRGVGSKGFVKTATGGRGVWYTSAP